MEEDIPPEWMWPLDHALKQWFEEVDRRRAAERGGQQHQQTTMVDNALFPDELR